MFGDLVVFGCIVLLIVLKYGKLGKAAVQIDGHTYYKREKPAFTSKRRQFRGVLFALLLLQSHGGALGMGAHMDRGMQGSNAENDFSSFMGIVMATAKDACTATTSPEQ